MGKVKKEIGNNIFFSKIFNIKNLIIGLLFAVALKLFSARIADYDLFGHLKIGALLLKDFSLLKIDTFSFTAPDALVVNHEWGSQMILSLIHTSFGAAGLIALKISTGMMTAYFLFRAITKKTSNIIVTALIFLLAIQVVARGFLFRPQIFSYLFFALQAYIFTLYQDNRRIIFIMPLVMLLWVNMHGAFVAGLGFMFFFYVTETYTLFSRDKRDFYRSREFITLTAVALASFLLTFANPYGPRLYLYIAYEMGLEVSKKYITEWQSFSFAAREMPFFAIFVLSLIAITFSKLRLRMRDLLIPTAAAFLGFSSVRHTPIFGIMAVALIAERLGEVADRFNIGRESREDKSLSEKVVKVLLAAGIAFFIFLSIGVELPEKLAIYLDEDPYPVYTTRFIKENDLKGKLWVPHSYGMYALYLLAPDVKVSIDGRWATVYPEDVMLEAMDFSFKYDLNRKMEILDKYSPDMVMIFKRNYVADKLVNSGKYEFVYEDYASKLFVRKGYPLPAELKYPELEEYHVLRKL